MQQSRFTIIVIILNLTVGLGETFMWTLQTCYPTMGKNFRSIALRKGITILFNRGCMNFVIYFYLTCGLPISLGFFSYKYVAAGFGNFLVPQGSLISCNIISKCGKESLMFQNPFLIRIPYSS